MTIEFMPNPSGAPHHYGPSSVFKLRYEFLDTSLGGAPLEPFSKASGPKAMPEPAALLQTQSKSCNRVYRYINLFISSVSSTVETVVMMIIYYFLDRMRLPEEYFDHRQMYSCLVEVDRQIFHAPFDLKVVQMKPSGKECWFKQISFPLIKKPYFFKNDYKLLLVFFILPVVAVVFDLPMLG